MGFLQKLRGFAQSRENADGKKYVQYLRRRESLTDDEVADFVEVQRRLGITDLQVNDDLIAIDKGMQLAKEAWPHEELPPAEALERGVAAAASRLRDAEQAKARIAPKVERLLKQANDLRGAAWTKVDEAERQSTKLHFLQMRFQELLNGYGYLFGGDFPRKAGAAALDRYPGEMEAMGSRVNSMSREERESRGILNPSRADLESDLPDDTNRPTTASLAGVTQYVPQLSRACEPPPREEPKEDSAEMEGDGEPAGEMGQKAGEENSA